MPVVANQTVDRRRKCANACLFLPTVEAGSSRDAVSDSFRTHNHGNDAYFRMDSVLAS